MKKTYVLIIICILVSFFCWEYPTFAEDYFAYNGSRLIKGALWTPFTALFVHFDLVHLIGNMVFLYVFGKVVEEEAGAKMTILPFFVGGVCSSVISSFFYGFDVLMIGASGAIFTLAAMAVLIKPLKSSLFFFFIPLGLVAILYFIFNVFAVILDLGGNVGYVAHVAGFLIGIPFGIALSKGKWIKNLAFTTLMLVTFLAIIYLIQFLLNLL